jgi:chemotaxis signal transduction protein
MANTAETLENKGPFESDSMEVVTFQVADTLFACPVSQVRYIEQDNRKTTRMETSQGCNEVTTYQGRPVPIYDFCSMMGSNAEYHDNRNLINELKAREKDHVSWMNALENAIQNGGEFTKPRDPSECAFGKWYAQFEASDLILSDILSDMEEPHRRIHSLANHLLAMRDNGEKDQALKLMALEKNRTLEKLIDLFSMAQSRIESITKPILLFVETKSKMVAFRLNAISDLKSISRSQFCEFKEVESHDMKQLAFVSGFIQIEQDAPMVLIDWSLFTAPVPISIPDMPS